MPERLRVPEGLLRWAGEEIRVGFQVDISRFGDVSIELDTLQYSRGESWMEYFNLLNNLYRGESRVVPYFHLSGHAQTGVMVSTDFAYLTGFRHNTSEDQTSIEGGASAAEIRIDDVSSGERLQSAASIEYQSRAQLGLVSSVDTAVGTLTAAGSTNIKDFTNQFGFVAIERSKADVGDTSEWIEACDKMVEWVLKMISLAQGRRLLWTTKAVFDQDGLVSRTIRPQELQQQVLASLFHHVNLGPVLRLASESFDREIPGETGLPVALSWMLSSATSLENRYLNLLIALEHLIAAHDSKFDGVLPKAQFRSNVRQPLLDLLERLHEEGRIPESALKLFGNKISQFNGASLYEKIEQIVEYYSVPVKDIRGEMKDVLVGARNNLIHRGILPQDVSDSHTMQRMFDIAEEFLKRLVMSLLGYKGQYQSALYDLELYQFGEGEVCPLNTATPASGCDEEAEP